MKKQLFYTTIALGLLGGNYFLHLSNHKLTQGIQQAANQCEAKIADLQSRYDDRFSALPIAIAQAESSSVGRAPESTAARPAVNLENLISYRHRVQAVTQKYEFLLASAQLNDADKRLLRRMLTEREQLANALAFTTQGPNSEAKKLQTQLYQAENSIADLLSDPLDYQRYELFRERSL